MSLIFFKIILSKYRVKYSSEPPPELKFEEFEDIYENEHWSRCQQFEAGIENMRLKKKGLKQLRVPFVFYIKLITFECSETNVHVNFCYLYVHHKVTGISLVSCNAITSIQH